MAKRRVYELARDYGMKGPAFVRVLKDLGFEKVRTHMAVLDDADQMVIEVRLGASGYDKAPVDDAATRTKKPPLRKKPKKKETKAKEEPVAAAPSAGKTPAIRKKLKKAPEEQLPEPLAETGARLAEAIEELPDPGVGTEGVLEPEELEEVEATVLAPETTPLPPTPLASPLHEAAGDLGDSGETLEVIEDGESDDASGAPTPLRRVPASTDAAEQMDAEPVSGELAETVEESVEELVGSDVDAQIRRLPEPERKATILGRIDLPKETISDAKARSAPGGPRNPANVDRNLRKAALDHFRSRTASKGILPARRSGPVSPGRGFPSAGPRKAKGGRRVKVDPLAPPPGIDPEKLVVVQSPVSVKKLSEALGHKVSQLLMVLLRLGVNANINSFLDKEQVELVALELVRNVIVEEERLAEDEFIAKIEEQTKTELIEKVVTRPPIVTFMGHVDHGKTTLVDALRKSEIQRGEAGGITQHLGAYRVTHGEHSVVILDTPGHAAFTAMRARGANLTDVVVLVVAADDGVMPQTEEALDHAKAAEVPVVVAINKCDKPDANPMRARQQLSALGLQPEEWGGNTQFVDVSALSGEGLDELIEKIGLEALVLELKANPDGHASGTVIEAKQTPAQGNVVSLLVMDGTLNRGDLVLCGHGTGRIRVLLDDHGRQLDQAPPGTPVEVLGLPELPSPGDRFHALEDMKMAKEVAQARAQKIRSMDIAEKSKARMMDLQSQLAAKKVAEIRLILKADVMGSLEPIRESLEKLSTDEVRLRILHAGIGGITETDVSLADASDALIVGFNSTLDEKARAKADQDGVQVRFYNVIYELIDDARNVLEGLLSPELKEEIRGHAEVRRVFKSSKFGNIAGCFVLDGIINRNHKCRVKRGGSLIHTSRISSLRREKDDVRDVRENFECGIRVEGFNDYQADDILEAFEVVEIKRTLGDPV